jgi:hypothetical protein
MQTITFPRDLYFLPAAIGNQNPQILELRSSSSGRDQRSRLQRSVTPKAFGVMPAGGSAKKNASFRSRKSSEHRRKGDGARKSYVWLHAKFAKMNMTRHLR